MSDRKRGRAEDAIPNQEAVEEENKAQTKQEKARFDEPLYVISVAARLAGLPLWTLRVLDKEGIVRPQRTTKDRRLYSDHDIARLARVRYLTEERGVNMNGVKFILETEQAQETPARSDEPS